MNTKNMFIVTGRKLYFLVVNVDMDRGLRGSGSEGYRNPSTSHYSSDYGSRNFDHSQQYRRGRGSGSSTHWSGDRSSYAAPKEYERYSSSERGIICVSTISNFISLKILYYRIQKEV